MSGVYKVVFPFGAEGGIESSCWVRKQVGKKGRGREEGREGEGKSEGKKGREWKEKGRQG